MYGAYNLLSAGKKKIKPLPDPVSDPGIKEKADPEQARGNRVTRPIKNLIFVKLAQLKLVETHDVTRLICVLLLKYCSFTYIKKSR